MWVWVLKCRIRGATSFRGCVDEVRRLRAVHEEGYRYANHHRGAALDRTVARDWWRRHETVRDRAPEAEECGPGERAGAARHPSNRRVGASSRSNAARLGRGRLRPRPASSAAGGGPLRLARRGSDSGGARTGACLVSAPERSRVPSPRREAWLAHKVPRFLAPCATNAAIQAAAICSS